MGLALWRRTCVEVYEIRVNGIADGITEMANKNGIGVKRGNLRELAIFCPEIRFSRDDGTV